MPVSLQHPDPFVGRHLGPREADQKKMLDALGVASLDALVAETVPATIRTQAPLDLGAPLSERELLTLSRDLGQRNAAYKSYLGMGYSGTVTPPVIQRNILENPGWYTQYTPYQAEIAQGRLEALLNFQTVVSDLTGLPIANASLLDEATAAAEAMHVSYAARGSDGKRTFFVAADCHPQVVDVVRTRALALGLTVEVGSPFAADLSRAFGVLVSYPTTFGAVGDLRVAAKAAHDAGALFVVACDLLALTLLVPPGELGADIAVGSSQRFGVPLGYGGPHAAFFACTNEHVRKLPGRIIGVSRDASGRPALRMALQTREQHIRRERATSNICTAQALLAIVASMYAVYHGPEGLTAIAERVHGLAAVLAEGVRRGQTFRLVHDTFFDTVLFEGGEADVRRVLDSAEAARINLRRVSATRLGVALDETTTDEDVAELLRVFGVATADRALVTKLAGEIDSPITGELRRKSAFLGHAVFHEHRSETEMLRYMRKLEGRDLSLTHAMIPLGSCTMKLNATAEMMPITNPAWNGVHPFVPPRQAAGYAQIFAELEGALAKITGFPAVSLQPNAGAQGEYAGLLVIRKHHEKRGEGHRTVCLIPQSAHGTNPASAVMAGFEVVVVATDAQGNVDLADLEAKAEKHADRLGALMVTYPSTHGVFEEQIKRVTAIVHEHGGQVYMDGANMNAQVGLTCPAEIGADVCHLNLHKTFCIPHGGGGPGMGPIAVAAHLAPYLPRKPVIEEDDGNRIGPVSAAPWGSASINLISWAYVRMMGGAGLTRATQIAILNANYIAHRLAPHYPIVYRGAHGRVAHECIFDVRPFKKTASVEAEDIAKRLVDYGFHAPTMSFPIAGTLMVEPTESEPLAEIDRFCDAMIGIREEIRAIEEGKLPKDDNPLKHAPHTAFVVTASEWKHAYSREVAAYPAPWTRERKFFPFVGRVDNAQGDRNLVCTCPPIEAYAAE